MMAHVYGDGMAGDGDGCGDGDGLAGELDGGGDGRGSHGIAVADGIGCGSTTLVRGDGYGSSGAMFLGDSVANYGPDDAPFVTTALATPCTVLDAIARTLTTPTFSTQR